jgi:uncharacterized protein (TIGR03067 family)
MRFRALMIWTAYLLVAADAPRKGATPPKPDKPLTDADRLQGTWTVVSIEYKGKAVPRDVIRDYQLVFTGQTITTRRGGKVVAEGRYWLRASESPKQLITMRTKGRKEEEIPCIYLLEGDTLKICGPDTTGEAPKAFATKADNDHILMVLRRAQP